MGCTKKSLILLGLLFALVFATTGMAFENLPTWGADWPDPDKPAAGFQLMPEVDHFMISRGSAEMGMYNHGPIAMYHHNRFYVMWYSHQNCEDASGQRILFSTSIDGEKWEPTGVLFDSLSPVAWRGATGVVQHPHGGFWAAGDRLYAVSSAKLSRWDDKESGSNTYESLGLLAARMNPDGTHGQVFWFSEDPPPPYAAMYPSYRELGAEVIADVEDIAAQKQQKRYEEGAYPPNPPDVTLCEDSIYTRPDGIQIRLFRDDKRSLRTFASQRSSVDDLWSDAVKTTIPNSTALTVAGTLPDGRVYIIGNFIEKLWCRDPLLMAISDDGIQFDSVRAVCSGAPPLREKKSMDGKGTGFQYPRVLMNDGSMWVFYSIGKEDIGVSRIPLNAIPAQ